MIKYLGISNQRVFFIEIEYQPSLIVVPVLTCIPFQLEFFHVGILQIVQLSLDWNLLKINEILHIFRNMELITETRKRIIKLY